MSASATASKTNGTATKAKSKSNNGDSDLRELFVEQLRDILWAENHLVKALPKMAKAAKSSNLRKAFESHLSETKGHVDRLGQVLDSMGLSARGKKCPAMEGLLKEGDEIAEDYKDSPALDAALICAAQKVEHYEIATYGTLCAFARRLGHNSAADLLEKTLKEESACDEKLTKLAMSEANPSA